MKILEGFSVVINTSKMHLMGSLGRIIQNCYVICNSSLRAFTTVLLNFLSILHKKTYFFYFTHPLLQNTHISLSILHIYSIKYSLFYNFLLFTPSLPLSLTDPQPPSPPSSPPSSPLSETKSH